MERLTLKDAITHAKEVAEKNYRGADFESIEDAVKDMDEKILNGKIIEYYKLEEMENGL